MERKNSFELAEIRDINFRVECGEAYEDIAAIYGADVDELRMAHQTYVNLIKNVK